MIATIWSMNIIVMARGGMSCMFALLVDIKIAHTTKAEHVTEAVVDITDRGL